jgi:hypothetical protein
LSYRFSGANEATICSKRGSPRSGLLGDPVCINALLLRRIDKVEPKNHLFLVSQKDVETVSVIPSL